MEECFLMCGFIIVIFDYLWMLVRIKYLGILGNFFVIEISYNVFGVCFIFN